MAHSVGRGGSGRQGMACEDPNHKHNGSRYHTGKPCVERGCSQPAGTWWSHLWCQRCNAERLVRVTGQLDAIAMSMAKRQLLALLTKELPPPDGHQHEIVTGRDGRTQLRVWAEWGEHVPLSFEPGDIDKPAGELVVEVLRLLGWVRAGRAMNRRGP